MKFLKLIEDDYKIQKLEECDQKHELSKVEYIAEQFFGYCTYEIEVSEFMTIKSLEICRAITDRKTMQYIKNIENNTWYLVLLHMPFFYKKIEWGTSIRATWWNIEDVLVNYSFIVKKDEWVEFINDLIEFSGVTITTSTLPANADDSAE